MIRIYGYEICPYRLPRYVSMRLFALEYYRQLINSDLTHFHSTKKKAQLKFKDQLGPFIMNKKEGWQEADLILKDQCNLKRSFWWVPYDPLGFISAQRVKYRLTPYDHYKNPHIEKYANQDAWAQGTLVEEFTQEEILEQTAKDLEKTLDFDSADQVTFKLPYQVEEGTSIAATSQVAQGASTSAKGIAKGKEPMETEQGMVIEQPLTSMEETQGKAPPQKTEALQVPPLQTPVNEERGRRRDREDSTLASGSVKQLESKRQRVDPPIEEEVSEEVIESPRRETSQHTPTSSFQQEQDRQHGMEVSSSTQQSKIPASIKASFKEIKAQNELLRVQLYEQFLKATPAKQERLMAAYDIKQEKMILSHFKPKFQHPQSAADFVKTRLEVLAKDIHPMDQIELHKKTGEMVYATLAEKAILAHELKESLKNTNTQLDFERLSSTAKDNRIKTLEDIIVDLGHDPKDPKGVRTLMKKKDDDIATLKKRLRMLPTKHPQTEEL